jgi:transposase
MTVPHIIGADLSKKSIDFANYQSGMHVKLENNVQGFKELIKWINQLQINKNELLIVMEHTGLYSYLFERFLLKHQISFAKVSALAIKRSLGLVRGKTDRKDAYRIAQYGFEKMSQLAVCKPAGKTLERLQMLHSVRERLVRNKAALITAVKEYQHSIGLKETDLLIASQLSVISMLDRQIGKLEKEIESLVNQEQSIKNNYDLLQSIKGVGKVLALTTIIKTANFTKFSNARKFACFCGTAPFENTSGTSIRGKTRVSHLADKRMKTLLDLGAKTAIQYDKELREYYLKRTSNGKSKMSTINVVRNKILYRMFAVVKRQTPFTDNYLQAA